MLEVALRPGARSRRILERAWVRVARQAVGSDGASHPSTTARAHYGAGSAS